MGPDYCRKACGGERCAKCPAPTLLSEAVPAVVAYTLAQTQWRTGAVGRTGLDYPACAWTWATYRARAAREGVDALPPDDELLDHVAVIEHAYLHTDSERAAADRERRDTRAIGDADGTIGA